MRHTLQNITSKIGEMKNKYQHEGFNIIGIFGSFAQNSADDFSDVDIAYSIDYDTFNRNFKGGFAKILRIEEIKEDLQTMLHLKVDLISLNSSNDTFKQNIQKDIVYV
jgi:predicted nucleotidyltransferase